MSDTSVQEQILSVKECTTVHDQCPWEVMQIMNTQHDQTQNTCSIAGMEQSNKENVLLHIEETDSNRDHS